MNLVTLASVAMSAVLSATALAQPESDDRTHLRVLSFNILQGGGDASNVGFTPEQFGPSRIDEIAAIITALKVDVVGVQEDAGSDALLEALGEPWRRAGNIYSRLPLESLESEGSVQLARITFEGSPIVVANAHWRPSPYGPYKLQETVQMAHDAGDRFDMEWSELEFFLLSFSDKGEGRRGYAETWNAIRQHIESDHPIILTGDFNEPSHLDWTSRSAKDGMDRWVKNPTGVPLRAKVRWAGSRWLANEGLVDAYRKAHPDELAKPGITWTPAYPSSTPGRRDYDTQCCGFVSEYLERDYGGLVEPAREFRFSVTLKGVGTLFDLNSRIQ